MPLSVDFCKHYFWDKVICRNSAFPFQTFIFPGFTQKSTGKPAKTHRVGFYGLIPWFFEPCTVVKHNKMMCHAQEP